MNDFFVGIEAKLFCSLMIAFLYVFQTKNFQFRCKEGKLLYSFSFIGVLLAIAGSFVTMQSIRVLCIVVGALSCALAAYFCIRYIFCIMECKKTTSKTVMCTCISIVFGVISFYLLKHGLNTASYILVFALVAVLVAEQNLKIKVDNLTKLYNRYGMDAELKEQLRQYKREKSDSFYIIACDLDNFKHINDTWGHPEGDRALVLIAGALAKVGKMFTSNVFRIGGDEFVIITDTSEAGLAHSITEAIETELDNIDFRSDFDIEMSIGVALYDGVTPIDELLSSADKRLYEAKKKRK